MFTSLNKEFKDIFLKLTGSGVGFGIDFSNGFAINHVLIFSTIIFMVGLIGVLLVKHNLIITLMCLEMMLLGLSVDFLVISYFYMDVVGHIFALVILTLAAAESAIALAIFINLYKVYRNLDLKKISKLSSWGNSLMVKMLVSKTKAIGSNPIFLDYI